MLNRTLRESATGAGRNAPPKHRRGLSLSLNGAPISSDDPVDLFFKGRCSLSVASSDESDVPVKLGRLSLGSARQGHSRLDDVLSSAEGGKHDYDWLLTPPGTPLVSSSDGNGSGFPTDLMAPRSAPLVRSISTTTKASRLSVSQPENKHHAAKSTRSNSVTRPSASNSQYSTYSNKSTNILNTSSASISSYIRPSTPPKRSSSVTRPSTPSRPSVSRSTTPAKPRPSVSVSSMDKTRPPSNSRPSTPTSRSQISANSNSTSARTTSRPSTPTRRNPSPSLSPVSGSSTPGGCSLTNGRSVASVSRPSSPGPRARTPSQPIVIPDFPHDTPPNLRTTLPDRPLSAGRSRPSAALASKGNAGPTPNTASVRRQPSPVVTRGRVGDPTGKGRPLGNGHLSDSMDSKRDSSTRKPTKTSTDSTVGIGRTISKKSLDMAIRHMDIRNGGNGIRPRTGSNLFPQSIRSTNQKTQPGAASAKGNLSISSNGAIAENGYQYSECGSEEDKSHSSAKLGNIDMYESSRYDMILLKEDLKNSNWLHGHDDKSDQGSIFDNGFEFLPEPFDPL